MWKSKYNSLEPVRDDKEKVLSKLKATEEQLREKTSSEKSLQSEVASLQTQETQLIEERSNLNE
jgi:hypothetical protein